MKCSIIDDLHKIKLGTLDDLLEDTADYKQGITLRYIHDEIIPTIGPVQVDSGYRDVGLNRCSGGAAHSAHAQFYALDLVPVRSIDRGALIARVCANHARYGAAYGIGLGFYDHERFHIDSRSFRQWGSDYHSATSPCAHIGA